MKNCLILVFVFGLSLSTGCAVKSPEGIESSLLVQDGRLKESVRRNKARSEKRQKWWSDYKARNDAKYDRWVDGIMD